MVKVIATLILLLTLPAAALEPKGWSLLYGVGNNLTPNGTIRVGYKQWEFGKLNNWAYGASKNFYFSNSYYTSFGLALMPTQAGTTAGLVAALGANWELFWGVCLRLEISANASANATLFEQGILGVGYDF